jgi:hypothetical protein
MAKFIKNLLELILLKLLDSLKLDEFSFHLRGIFGVFRFILLNFYVFFDNLDPLSDNKFCKLTFLQRRQHLNVFQNSN